MSNNPAHVAKSQGLRIALVTELYEPSVGGQQTRFRAIAKGLRNLGCNVTVITTMHERHLEPEEELEGIRVLRGPLLPNYMNPRFAQTVRSPIGMIRFALRCRRILRSEDFDFVYFNQWPYLHIALAPRRALRNAGIDWCEVRSAAIHSLPQRRLPRMVPLNLAVTQWTAASLSIRANVHVGYLPSGVNCERFDSGPDNRKGLLFLGRLVTNKNLPLLIGGYVRYREIGGTEELTVAGSGPGDQVLRTLVSALSAPLRSSIHLNGEVSDEIKRDLLTNSVLLVMPSRREGFPNVVVEAMASGMPTVTVNSPENGTAHVVEQYGVGTVGEPSPDGLSEAIHRALETWPELHVRCIAVSKELDWSVLVRGFYELICSTISEEH